jgi:hypothetical protein
VASGLAVWSWRGRYGQGAKSATFLQGGVGEALGAGGAVWVGGLEAGRRGYGGVVGMFLLPASGRYYT